MDKSDKMQAMKAPKGLSKKKEKPGVGVLGKRKPGVLEWQGMNVSDVQKGWKEEGPMGPFKVHHTCCPSPWEVGLSVLFLILYRKWSRRRRSQGLDSHPHKEPLRKKILQSQARGVSARRSLRHLPSVEEEHWAGCRACFLAWMCLPGIVLASLPRFFFFLLIAR